MAPRLTLAEVWSNLQSQSGTALCAIRDLQSLTRTRALPGTGDNVLEGTLPRLSPAWAHLRELRVIRLTFMDPVTGAESVEEWRITELQEEASESAGYRSGFKALWPEIDLASCGEMERAEADGTIVDKFEPGPQTPTQYATLILARAADLGATHFTVGTIDAIGIVDLVLDKMTPLAALLYLAESISGTTGRRCEFQIRRNGGSNYFVDLITQIGGSAPRRYLQLGKNLQGVRRSRSAVDLATAVRVSGAAVDGVAASISEALWKVSATPSGTVFRLVDPAGGDGPILEDDQLNPMYFRKWPSGSWIQVADSARSNQEVTSSGAHGLATNDLVQFAADSTGKALTVLTSPSAIAIYGRKVKPLDRSDIPGHINLITNPAQRDYAASANGPPDGWAIIPGCGLAAANVDRETTRIRTGIYSTKLVTSGDGQGMETPYASISPLDAKPHFSGYHGFWNDTNGGRVRVDLLAGIATVGISSMSRAVNGIASGVAVTVNTSAVHGLAVGDLVEILGVTGGTTADGYNGVRKVSRIVDADTFEYQLTANPGTISLSSATMRKVWIYQATSQVSKAWDDLGYQNADLKARSATVAKMRIMQDGTTGLTLYAERAQLTQGKGEGQLAFIEGSGGTQLWQAANRYQNEKNTPEVQYDVEALDLGRLNPTVWKYDDIELGGAIDVDYQPIDLDVSTRVLGFTQELVGSEQGDDGVIRLTASSRPGDFTDETVRPSRPGRLPVGPPSLRRDVKTIHIQGGKFPPVSAADAANVFYQNLGTGQSATVQSGVTGRISGAVVDEMLARGGRIVAFRFGGFAVIGTVTVLLQRDGTTIATVATNAEQSDTTLNQLIGTETYSVYATLTGTNPGSQMVVDWVEIDVQIDLAAAE